MDNKIIWHLTSFCKLILIRFSKPDDPYYIQHDCRMFKSSCCGFDLLYKGLNIVTNLLTF